MPRGDNFSAGLGFTLTIDDKQLQEMLQNAARDVQNAFKTGMRRALAVIRERAAGSAPKRRWQNPNRGYRTSVDTRLGSSGGFSVVGKLWSKFPGGIYEAGQKEHFIAVTKQVEAWAKRHGVNLRRKGMWVKRGGKRYFLPWDAAEGGRLLRWAETHSVTLRDGTRRSLDKIGWLHVRQQPPRPWVIPAGEASEEEARDAFRVTIEEALADYG